MSHFLSILVLLFYRMFSCDEVVRLANLKLNKQGVQGDVEIYYNEQWRPLCSRGWQITSANVICKTTGFSEGAIAMDRDRLYGTTKHRNYYYQYLGLGCTGKETRVQECPNWNILVGVMDIKTCGQGIAIAVCKL